MCNMYIYNVDLLWFIHTYIKCFFRLYVNVCVHILRSSKINLDELTVHRWKLLPSTNPWAMADPFTVDILHLVGRYAQMANETLNDETGVASLEDASASRRTATLKNRHHWTIPWGRVFSWNWIRPKSQDSWSMGKFCTVYFDHT